VAQDSQRNKIQLKRTEKQIDNPVITSLGLDFGEPLYMDTEKYLIIGRKPTGTAADSLVPNQKVAKLVNRTVNYGGTNYPVADAQVFYKNRGALDDVAVLMDEEAAPIYPQTKTEAVVDQYGVTVAELIADKVDVDSASQKRSTLGYDSNGVFISEKVVTIGDLSQDLAALIANKVGIDEDSDPSYNPLSLGQDFIGVFVRINDGLSSETNFIQSYINNQVNFALNSVTVQLTNLQQQINNLSSYYVGTQAPADTNILWVDTSIGSGGLKYYDQTTNTWKLVP